MRISFWFQAIGAVAMFCCGAFSGTAQITDDQPASALQERIQIRVHAPASGKGTRAGEKAIPPTIFGSFLEPIGHSTYGGLWAEILENPSFEDGLWNTAAIAERVQQQPELLLPSEIELPLPWEPLYLKQGARYLPIWGDAANSSRSLLIMALPQAAEAAMAGAETGVRQRVYLPVHRELRYAGSVWVKHVSGPATVAVSLRERNHPEHVLASAHVEASSAEWTRYAFNLDLKRGSLAPLTPVDFVLSLRDDARALVDNASLMPADSVDGMDPDMIAMSRDLKSPLVRFGGNFTSGYDWRDGIGPREKRVSKINAAWGIPEYNTFGTDEFLRFCQLIGAQPQIALNLGTGTPQEAADWVKYVNEHWGDKQGGQLWELGNELWGTFQFGYPTMQKIAERTRTFSQAIHRVDPKARLIGTGGDEDSFRDWNARQLTNSPGTFDYLSTHFVVTTDRLETQGASKEATQLATFALPTGLGPRLEAMHEQIQASAHKDHVRTAFTEWLFYGQREAGASASQQPPSFTNMGGAISAAGFLNMLLQHHDIVPISDMTGIIEFGGLWKKREQVYGAPAYWVLRTYANTVPQRLLQVENSTPTYSVSKGITRLPEIANVPYLDVVAASGSGGKRLILYCVNRSVSHDLTAAVRWSDALPRATKATVADITTIAAASMDQENSEEHPDAIRAETRQERITGEFVHTFPRGSVTVIEITGP